MSGLVSPLPHMSL